MIVDRQGRRFRNLRISLTSACNYACTYCVPNGKRLVAAQDELSAEAMARGVAYLIEAAGIDRLRITGGEPLVSPKLETFMQAVGQMGLSDISLTTNGQLLARKLPLLVDAGIRRINVSLDTLDAAAFRGIARGRPGHGPRWHGPGACGGNQDQGQYGAVARAEPRPGHAPAGVLPGARL